MLFVCVIIATTKIFKNRNSMTIDNIDEIILEDIETSDHPSVFESANDYSALIMRLPEIDREGITIHSYAFVIENNEVYKYSRDSKQLIKMGAFDSLHGYLDAKIDNILSEIQSYHIDIDRLEESLYSDSTDSHFMDKWLMYKKDVSLINRLMLHAVISFERFIHRYKNFEGFEKMEYEDLLEHMRRIDYLSKSAMEKLDNLHSFYRTKVDEHMNKIMYWLTIISAIFLPLTLVTGFFGMNTGGLPYTDDNHGTLKVTVISMILEAIFLLAFISVSKRGIKSFKKKR